MNVLAVEEDVVLPFNDLTLGTISLCHLKKKKEIVHLIFALLVEMISKGPDPLVSSFEGNFILLLEVLKCLVKFLSNTFNSQDIL